MQSDSQQEKLLRKLNDIYLQLDNLFFNIDNPKMSNTQLKMAYVKLDLISNMLNEVLPVE